MAVGLLAILGSAFIAVRTTDEAVRLANIALCAILAVGNAALFFNRR